MLRFPYPKISSHCSPVLFLKISSMGLPKPLLQLTELPAMLQRAASVSHLWALAHADPSIWYAFFFSFSWQSPSRPFNIQLKFHLCCETFSDVLQIIHQSILLLQNCHTLYHLLHYITLFRLYVYIPTYF